MDASRLRDLRQQLRLSQSELKDRLNAQTGGRYDTPSLARWEQAREAIPEDVARALERMAQPPPAEARVLVLANQKGGVGKTTSALNIAYAFSRLGQRVLLVDMDPQATASIALLGEASAAAYRDGRSIAHVILHGRPLAETLLRAADLPALPFDLAASHIALAETDARREPGFDAALREALGEVVRHYDRIVIDAPPNLGMLTWMALAAADAVIIPVRTEPYDTMGVGLMLATITKVQRRLNPALRLAGILPTQYARRKLVDREVLAHLIAALGARAPVLAPVPDSAVFGHAARDGRIALALMPTAPATGVYLRLAQELLAGVALAQAPPPAPAADLQPADA